MPGILLTATTWWPSAARLAVALRDAGADVSAVAPTGNPIEKVRDLRHAVPYSAFRPLGTLREALERLHPDLVVPVDDRATAHLHALHAFLAARHAEGTVADLIVRSLGRPEFYPLLRTRAAMLNLLEGSGHDVAPTRDAGSADELRRWHDARPIRFVVKAENSWGGSGVLVADRPDASALRTIGNMRRPLTLRRAMRLALVDRDPYPLGQWRHRHEQRLALQPFIPGRSANLMAACWNGRLLGSVGAEVLRSQGPFGAATEVRISADPRMEAMAEHVARRFGISGFIGLDFIVAADTGRPVLIEINPRATQLGHLAVGGRSLAALLLDALAGRADATAARDADARVLGFFPQALRFAEGSGTPDLAWLDVPWGERQLVLELLRAPWTKRGLLSRLEAFLRPNPARGAPIPRAVADAIRERLGGAPDDGRPGPDRQPDGVGTASTTV